MAATAARKIPASTAAPPDDAGRVKSGVCGDGHEYLAVMNTRQGTESRPAIR